MAKNKSDSTSGGKQKSSKGNNGINQGPTFNNSPLGTNTTPATGGNINGSASPTGGSVNTPAGSGSINNGQTNLSIIGSSTINEGDTGSFALQVDSVSNVDRTFTMQVFGGTANRHNRDGAGQSYKGSAKLNGKEFSPDDTRDFTVYDAQGQIVTGETMQVTIGAGQTTSSQFNVMAWRETSNITGVGKNPDVAYGMAEGREVFHMQIVDGGGLNVPRPQMDVTIIDTSINKFHSPLSIDLNGDGVKSISISEGVKFDILNSGSKSNVGWISGNDGLLAIDNNGNGSIDNRGELFGGGVGEGFAKLGSFDTNGDGIVSAGDRGFDSLKIWKDSNTNGITDGGELQALSVFGIKSLNLAHQSTFSLDAQGNVMGERGSVNLASGKSADMTDVYFQVGNAVTTMDTILG